MKAYYAYILECSDNSCYVGITSNLSKRLYEHNAGIKKSSHTYNKRPVELKWCAEFTEAELAIAQEKQLKGWSRRKKKALVDRGWNKLVGYSKNYTQYGRD